MNAKAMSLKAKIKNYAIKNNIAAQVVLQNFMFERFWQDFHDLSTVKCL